MYLAVDPNKLPLSLPEPVKHSKCLLKTLSLVHSQSIPGREGRSLLPAFLHPWMPRSFSYKQVLKIHSIFNTLNFMAVFFFFFSQLHSANSTHAALLREFSANHHVLPDKFSVQGTSPAS